MASDIVTLKDHDLRSLIEQLSESRAAVAELVEVLAAALDEHDGHCGVSNDARHWSNSARSLLSRHQAGLGKGDERG